jgi:hypothetical protein
VKSQKKSNRSTWHLIVVTLHSRLWPEMPEPQKHACVQLQTLCASKKEGAVEADVA